MRRSRRRFWDGPESADGAAAFATLHSALVTVTKLMAPITPFLADYVWGVLRPADEAESVHLSSWPGYDASLIDADLSAQMALARRLVELGRSARSAAAVRTRQPLSRALVGASGFGSLPAALRELVEAKEKNLPLPLDEEKPQRSTKVVGLMDALRRSLNEAKKPEAGSRWDRPTERVALVLKHALLQLRTWRRLYPGLMHAMIFWGFIVLTIATTAETKVLNQLAKGGPLSGIRVAAAEPDPLQAGQDNAQPGRPRDLDDHALAAMRALPGVREALPVVTGHPAKQGTFSMHHFIMRKRENEIFVMVIKHRKGEVVLVVFTMNGLVAEIIQCVMHPAHVPFE